MPAVKGGFFCCGVEAAVFADRPDCHFPDGAPVGHAARFPAVDGQPARFLKAEKRGVDVGNVLRGLHVHRRLRRLNRRAVPFAAAIQPSAAAGVKRPKLFGKILVVPHDAVLVYAAGDVVDVRVADIAERIAGVGGQVNAGLSRQPGKPACGAAVIKKHRQTSCLCADEAGCARRARDLSPVRGGRSRKGGFTPKLFSAQNGFPARRQSGCACVRRPV